MEHITDLVCVAPMVQILDAPVPQMVDKLHDVLRFFDRLMTVPEQVIEVPKIHTEDVPMRAVLRATQLAEQLVEVPTILSYASLSFLQVMQRIVEQNVDIPAVGGGGTGGGFRGFLPGQAYSLTAEQIVDNPVPRRGFDEGLQGFPQDRVQQRVRSRSLTFQFRTVAGMTFLLRQRIFQIRQIKGFFALFPV